MSPARVEDPAATMASDSDLRKRPSVSEEGHPPSKRQRTLSSNTLMASTSKQELPKQAPSVKTADAMAKEGLKRGIAMVLNKVGFDTSDTIAMESFAGYAETYLESLIEDIKAFSNAARRSYPIPTDFDNSLKRFNITPSMLKPHLKPPVPKSKRIPAWEALSLPDSKESDLPILGDELDGAPEKAAKAFIPTSFPAFPSIHTYKYTPENAESVTHSDEFGGFDPSQASQTLTANGTQTQTQTRPLGPDEIPRGDPKKIREAAAKEAKAGEEALRRLMRASKIAKQKEVWATAQQEPARKERYDLWEAAMRELIEDDQKAKGNQMAPAAVHGQMGRFEIADHSMIVNADRRHLRQEIQRAAMASAQRKVAGQEGILGKG